MYFLNTAHVKALDESLLSQGEHFKFQGFGDTFLFVRCVCKYVQVCSFILPKIFTVSHIPGCGVTDHPASIIRLLQHGICPKVREHLVKSHRYKELLCFLEKLSLIPTLKLKFTGLRSNTGCNFLYPTCVIF